MNWKPPSNPYFRKRRRALGKVTESPLLGPPPKLNVARPKVYGSGSPGGPPRNTPPPQVPGAGALAQGGPGSRGGDRSPGSPSIGGGRSSTRRTVPGVLALGGSQSPSRASSASPLAQLLDTVDRAVSGALDAPEHALDEIASALDGVARTGRVAAARLPSLQKTKRVPRPPTYRSEVREALDTAGYEGKNTLGTPAIEDVLRASRKQGGLQANRQGQVTTPQTRRVSRAIAGSREGLDRRTRRLFDHPFAPGESIAPGDIALIAEQAGLPGRTFAQIAQGESDFQPAAVGDDAAVGYGNTFGLGLWQITTGVGNDDTIARHGGERAMMNPLRNAAAAKELYDASGQSISPWYGTDYVTDENAHVRLPPPLSRRMAAAAQSLGINIAPIRGSRPAPPQAASRFEAILTAAKQIEKAQLPYVFGGGHGQTPTPDPSSVPGYDCSSAVTYVLQKAGMNIPDTLAGHFGQYLKPGPGAVTVFEWNNGVEGHVFMRIGDKYWGTSVSNPAGGAGFFPAAAAQGSRQAAKAPLKVYHVPGLGREVAGSFGVNLRNTTPRRLPGPYDGARRFVSQVIGGPVHGDKEPGHDPLGLHTPGNPGYAQDIQGGTNAEGEPVGDQQATLDTIIDNLRERGADVPDLTYQAADAQWRGTVDGYEIELLAHPHGSGPHIHMGAEWTGESAAFPGIVLSGGGSGGSSGSGSTGGTEASILPGAGVQADKPTVSERPIIPISPLASPLNPAVPLPEGYTPLSGGAPSRPSSDGSGKLLDLLASLAGTVPEPTRRRLRVPRVG